MGLQPRVRKGRGNALFSDGSNAADTGKWPCGLQPEGSHEGELPPDGELHPDEGQLHEDDGGPQDRRDDEELSADGHSLERGPYKPRFGTRAYWVTHNDWDKSGFYEVHLFVQQSVVC